MSFLKTKLENKVVLVDSNDNQTGLANKDIVHTSQPSLHRATTVFLFDPKGNILITRRSKKKKLWSLYWDTSSSTHPMEDESYEKAAERKIKDELGLETKLELVDKFKYHAKYGDAGSEKEICALLTGEVNAPIQRNEDEVAEFHFVSPKKLQQKIKENPDQYTPWLKIALEKLLANQAWWPSSRQRPAKPPTLVQIQPTPPSSVGLTEKDFSFESRKKLKGALKKISLLSPEQVFEYMRETARDVDSYTTMFFERIKDPLVREISFYSSSIRMGEKRGKPKARASIERLAFEMFSDKSWRDYIMPVCASEELLATSTYDIDDILDNQELREGKPTCLAKYELNNTICASFIQRELSEEMIFDTKNPIEIQTRIIELHNKLHRIIYEGQMIDVNMTKPTTFEQYIERCYQIAGVFGHLGIQKGAIVGGADEEQIQATGEFGKYYALQGQTRNDFMNLIPQDVIEGRSRTLTRNSFEDLRNGKWTYPVIFAMEKADEKQKKILIGLLGNQKTDIKEFIKAIGVLIDVGAMDAQINLIFELGYRALKSLEKLPDNSSKKYLQSLIFLITNVEDFLNKTKNILKQF